MVLSQKRRILFTLLLTQGIIRKKERAVEMSSKKTFGEYLRTKRTESDLTQKGLADKLYVTESAGSKWERGLSYPDTTLIIDLCEILAQQISLKRV